MELHGAGIRSENVALIAAASCRRAALTVEPDRERVAVAAQVEPRADPIAAVQAKRVVRAGRRGAVREFADICCRWPDRWGPRYSRDGSENRSTTECVKGQLDDSAPRLSGRDLADKNGRSNSRWKPRAVINVTGTEASSKSTKSCGLQTRDARNSHSM